MFNPHWRSECETALARMPVSCFIATVKDEDGASRMVGFGCYDATAKGFFGPTGVDPEFRGRGLGKALLLACLDAMRAEGYGYAIIGGAGPVDFYAKCVGAIPIEGSAPGIYRGMLR
jgi:GNAT superfamily N-acetyltransferase